MYTLVATTVERRRSGATPADGLRKRNGQMAVPPREGPALCIACPQLDAYSETFIANHIARLPVPVRVLHGKPPQYDGNGQSVLRPPASIRMLNRLRRRFFRTGQQQFNVEAMARFFRRENIAVVLAEYGPTGVRVMADCVRNDLPLVVHFHGCDAYVTEAIKVYRRPYAEMFQRAAAIVAVSRDMQGQLISLGAPAEKIAYIPYGVNTATFDKATPASAAPHFLAVGRFVEKKAPYLTLLAFRKVLSACPEARLTMIGDGPLLGPCDRLARALAVRDAVELSGAREHHAVCTAMRRARAFVQHSLRASDGDCEGTPVAVIEAQSAGLPVVATAHAGIKDVVIDGQTGLLVAEGDVDAMAVAMIELASDPGRAAELGAAGRQRICESFSLEQSLAKLARLVQNVSGGRIRPDQRANEVHGR